MRSLVRDEQTGHIWALSHRHVLDVRVLDDDADMWRLYLERALHGDTTLPDHELSDFRTALRFARVREAYLNILECAWCQPRFAMCFIRGRRRSSAKKFDDRKRCTVSTPGGLTKLPCVCSTG